MDVKKEKMRSNGKSDFANAFPLPQIDGRDTLTL